MPWTNTHELLRVQTPRLVLRCWTLGDVPAMLAAIEASVDHLRPWLPWAAHEPEPAERKEALVRRFQRNFQLGRDLVYGIFHGGDGGVVGGCGIHRRIGAGAAEIGYWISADRINQGYATEASAALVHIGFERLGLHLIEVHCDQANAPSAAVPRKLGFEKLAPIPGWISEPGAAPRDTVIFRMTRAQYRASPAAQVQVNSSGEPGGGS
ncbi:MAG: GNAT family N-acetyltransferase [Deltaproteobacteria bacterium]|jgi:RimJ/RimL family protein N-acetyltransferase|nr:GNAT family N-acetyltransferase [Deltaproteobacteria bacterium]